MSIVSASSFEEAIPSDFDIATYKEISALVENKKDKFPHECDQFRHAWRAVAFRYLSCVEHDEIFTESITKAGTAPRWPHRYIQDKEAFAFFITGFSSIETFYFAVYTIGSMIRGAQDFPIQTRQDLLSINPKSTAYQYRQSFPNENVTAVLQNIRGHNEFSKWREIRNSLIHHSAPTRHFRLSTAGQATGDDTWKHPAFEVTLNSQTTRSKRQWLSESFSHLFEATFDFVSSRL